MLVLTRRTGQTVMIGDDVTLVILGVDGNKVRIGFEADRKIGIDRLELFLRKKAEGAAPRSTHKRPAREAKV